MLVNVGRRLAEFKAAISGRIRLQTCARGVQGVWARANWACGCVAEGPDLDDLLLLERCYDHSTMRLPDRS
jgi:hypothetical protein